MRCGSLRCAASRAMARKGVMPMPPARNTACRAASSCSTIRPAGPSISTSRPGAAPLSARLNALSRIRVAIVRCGSCGAEAILNVRLSPPSFNSAFWPAWWTKPEGRSKWNALVPSATVSRPSRRTEMSVVTDAIEGVGHLVALARFVVPVELSGFLGLRQLVRAVAVRLVLRQAAAAEPLLLAVDHVLRRLREGALNESSHRYSLL